MAQRNDDELAFYLTQAVKASGQISDEDSAYLLAQLSPYTGAAQINDLWRSFWVAAGIPNGDYAGMAYAWLVSQGIPAGSISDMWHAYFEDIIMQLLKTGQITSYAVGDDGDLQKGMPPSYILLTTGQYAGTTNIVVNAKTEVLSNSCAIQNGTSLMWTRERPNQIGLNSDGGLYWVDATNNETIFEYALQANAAILAGYNDWRVPNITEMKSIVRYEPPAPYYDGTVFTNIEPLSSLWTSTSYPEGPTTDGLVVHFSSSTSGFKPKTSAPIPTLLVRNA